MNKDTAKELSEVLEESKINSEEKLTQQINEDKKKVQEKNSLIKEQFKSLSDSVSKYLQTSTEFTSLDSKLQNAFTTNFGDFDFDIDTIMDDYDGDITSFIYSEFIEPMKDLKPEAQEKIADLLNINPDNLHLENYKYAISKALDDAFPNDKEAQNSFKTIFGLDQLTEEVSDKTKVLKEKFGDAINDLNIKEINTAYDIVMSDNADEVGYDFDKLKKKIEDTIAAGATAIDLKDNSAFSAIDAADESANAGDDYVKGVTYLTEAKESFDKGLIGTDDFKTRAAYFSPTGADDAVNFAENYNKAARYMTEDATGVQNFLTDLEKKGYAASQALADGSKQWTYNIGDITDAAKDMGMSFDWFMDMFGRLEDYGAHNNFVGSVADGAERITDLSSKIAKAQAELAELQATGADNTAITQKKNEIAALQNDLAETRSATEQLAKHSADEYAEKIKQGKEQITTLLTERDRIKSTKAYGTDTDEVAKALETEIQKIANENGIELDANLNIVNAEEELDKISNKVIGIDVDLNNADELKEQAQKLLEQHKIWLINILWAMQKHMELMTQQSILIQQINKILTIKLPLFKKRC